MTFSSSMQDYVTVLLEAVERGDSTTLDFFMRDYVGHLRHHLRQVLDVKEEPWLADS
jgi:hypothetical protein